MIEWVALQKSKAETEIKERTDKAEADINKKITSHVAVLKKWEAERKKRNK